MMGNIRRPEHRGAQQNLGPICHGGWVVRAMVEKAPTEGANNEHESTK